MAMQKFNPDLTTGFGSKSSDAGRRFYRKDGEPNVERKGVPFMDRFSWFHTWLAMSRWKFWFSLTMLFIIINIFFAIIYFFIGVESLGGVHTGSKFENFMEAFFFSTQTFTTVGYGHISPSGFLASGVAAFEAFLGVLSFALASGLFYGRFSMPRPYLYFSSIAVIGPYKKNGKALMLRTAPYKNNNLTDAEVKLNLAIRTVDPETQMEKNDFFSLPVEFSKINVLVLNWTIVHPINEESPLYGYSMDQLKKMKAEILVFIRAYDEVFANAVVARTSYVASEIVYGAKFKSMYHSSAEGNTTILELNRLNDYERMELD
jgi:inward rectifier potassium channel